MPFPDQYSDLQKTVVISSRRETDGIRLTLIRLIIMSLDIVIF